MKFVTGLAVSLVFSAALLFSGAVSMASEETGAVQPGPKDKCPVCGMFVTPYPEWVAQIVFKDGSYAVFDGAKDMFKYYLDISRYNREKSADDISGVYVTEYYSTKTMPAKDVYFVPGSDVLGPMGKELVPVKGKESAAAFIRDHNGSKMLAFDDITLEDVPR